MVPTSLCSCISLALPSSSASIYSNDDFWRILPKTYQQNQSNLYTRNRVFQLLLQFLVEKGSKFVIVFGGLLGLIVSCSLIINNKGCSLSSPRYMLHVQFHLVPPHMRHPFLLKCNYKLLYQKDCCARWFLFANPQEGMNECGLSIIK